MESLLTTIFISIFSVSTFGNIEKLDIPYSAPKDTVPNKIIAVVSPTKMNVLYIGVDNPVSIAVSGVSMDRVTVESSPNAKILGEKGNYIVRAKGPSGSICKISILVDGKLVSEQEFRVKKVPDPVAVIRGHIRPFEITKENLITSGGIEAEIQNFDFDLKYEIVSFNVSATVNGVIKTSAQKNGNLFTEEQIELIKLVSPEQKIYIEDVMAKGPDGSIRMLNTITLKLK